MQLTLEWKEGGMTLTCMPAGQGFVQVELSEEGAGYIGTFLLSPESQTALSFFMGAIEAMNQVPVEEEEE